MLFEQLDYLYVPSRDVSADVAYATDWWTEWVWTTVVSPRSSNSTQSSEMWPGAPSNSKVWTIPAGDGAPWKTPWNTNALPASSRWV